MTDAFEYDFGTKVISSSEVEQAVLGSVLLSPAVLDTISTEVRLRPEHFYREAHQKVWASMLRIASAGGQVDVLTVKEDLDRHQELDVVGGKAAVDRLAGAVPGVGGALSYARRVRVLANLRRDQRAGIMLVNSAENEDGDLRDEALSLLLSDDSGSVSSSNPEQLAEILLHHLEGEGGEAFRWPFAELDDCMNGGARRGELTVVGGHSSHGKTVFVDQCGAHFAEQGLIVHAWLNEMTRLQRACRLVAAPSGVSFSRIMRGQLSESEHDRVMAALRRLPFGITEAAGWSAEEIARDIARRRPDVAIVDILHLIPHSDEKDLARISRTLNGAAKTANCHLLVTAHLNEGRKNQDGTKPAPTMADIRGSGSIKNDADNVLFVFRSQESGSGQPREDGWVYTGKVRNGRHGRLRVVLNARAMVFDEMVAGFDDEMEAA